MSSSNTEIAREYQRLVVAESRANKRVWEREYWAKNKESLNEKRRARNIANPEVRKAQRKRYYEKHKEQIKLAWKEYREKNKVQVKEAGERYRKTPKGRLQMYKSAADSRGLTFSLDTNDFNEMLTQNCHYCGEKAGGIDRLDSRLGYEAFNVVPCCWTCNRMKNDLHHDNFIEHLKKIISNMSN